MVYILLLCALAVMAGCATAEPVWRGRALVSLQQLEKDNAARIRPEAIQSIKETIRKGELLFVGEDDEELADLQFQLAYQKSLILKAELVEYRAKLAEEARRKAEAERVRLEEEERKREAAAKALEEERLRKAEAAAKATGSKSVSSTDDPNSLTQREKPTLPATYTVRRGESLPQIASRPEIYSDSTLWPLIYRANRDQVRDPYQLWPGQVLKIPRSYSREEAAEARKQSHRRSP